MKITVAGLGYVGRPNAIVLAQCAEVTAFDISLFARTSFWEIEEQVSEYNSDRLSSFSTRPIVCDDQKDAYSSADVVIICTPTDYDPETGKFNTSSVEQVISTALRYRSDTTFIVRSTVPIGFTENLRVRFNHPDIFFVPEFLREGDGLWDTLNPSRIVLGGHNDKLSRVAEFFSQMAEKSDFEVFETDPTTAESVKLFANSYLALRVAFFNELDSFALVNGADPRMLIKGICSDPRIGEYYNNPSFGFGGYCLPKDSKQLDFHFRENQVPQDLVSATIASNQTRKQFIVDQVLSRSPKTVGIYRLAMKAGSTNSRESAILQIVEKLVGANVNVVLFEPELDCELPAGVSLVEDIDVLKTKSELILANRTSDDLSDVAHKLFTRDIFNES